MENGFGDSPSHKEKKSDASSVVIPETAHQVSNDSWFQVGVVLSMGVNSAYALGYSGTIMVPLGWIGGVVGLVLSTVVSLYASALMAKLHEVGGKRHIRYRDLAGFLYGRTAYMLIWALQYANLFLINIGYVIMSGSALKAFYILFKEEHHLKLPHFIAIAGVACILFAIATPHLSALRIWLGFSSLFMLLYLAIAFVLSIEDVFANKKLQDASQCRISPVCHIIHGKATRFFQYSMSLLFFLSFISRKFSKIARNSW